MGEKPVMGPLREALRGKFVIVNLGSAGDGDYDLPEELRRAATLVEIDAGEEGADVRCEYHARHSLRTFVAGEAGRRSFVHRRFPPCSSLRAPRPGVVEKYGLEEFFRVRRVDEVETATLPALLSELGIASVDFLKTDLEGEDADVLRGAVASFPGLLAVVCELRFEPFFEGEPAFHEVAALLDGAGFRLVGLRPEYWRPAAPGRASHPDGQAVFADCLFVRKELVDAAAEGTDSLRAAKGVILLSMLGKRSLASWLLRRSAPLLPGGWEETLRPLVAPKGPARPRSGGGVLHELSRLARRSPAWPLLAPLASLAGRLGGGYDFSHLADTRDNAR